MVRRLFRQMAAAQIASSATAMISLLIDSFVIGRLLGSRALSAYGLANPLLIVYAAIGNMLVCGVQVVCGKSMGRGDKEETNASFSSSVVIALALSALAVVVVMAAWWPLCVLLGAGSPGDPLFRMTGDYLRGYTLGIPFFFLCQIMTPCLQLLGKRKLMLCSVAVITVTDIAFDFLSVCVFDAGIFGIGVATGASYLAAVLVLAVFFLKKDCILRFSWNRVRWDAVTDILKAGCPMFISDGCFILKVYMTNLLLLSIAGENAIAAFSVITTLTNLIFCTGFGSGSVTLTLASVFYGEEDRSSLLELLRAMAPFSLLLILSAAALTWCFAPWLAGAFIQADSAALPLATGGLRLFVLSLIPAMLSNNLRSYCQGIRRTGTANLIAVMRLVFPAIPVIWVFGRLFGLNGAWLGMVLAEMIALAAIAAFAWRRERGISFSAETFSFLERDFGAPEENCLELTVGAERDVTEASERICAFCREKGLGSRTAMLLGLCEEEIANNIIQHGFTKDRKAHGIHVRLVLKPDRTILRIRDDCAHFDPVRYLELHEDDDPIRHIGLRMTMALVKDAVYTNSLGFNNLTLVV